MSRREGFTLLELAVVIAILSMVVIAAAPMRAWIQPMGAELAAAQLRGDLQMARLMAIRSKQSCSVMIHQPALNQYVNTLSRQSVDLRSYRGGVHFLPQGPDGKKAAQAITFNRRGMASSFGAVYLADQELTHIYRLRVLTPGGISVFRWNGNDWR